MTRPTKWQVWASLGLLLIASAVWVTPHLTHWLHGIQTIRLGRSQLAILMAIIGLTSLSAVFSRTLRSRKDATSSAAPLPPARPLRAIPTWVLLVAALTFGFITWVAVDLLNRTVPTIGSDIERARLRVDATRTGLAVGAGTVGILGLLLAFRRQQISERTQQANEYDASEKRVTDLYVKAADQLGSDRAPVRLAGLYSLERVAQENPTHRQAIVNVICAYIRIPLSDPDAAAGIQSSNSPELGSNQKENKKEESRSYELKAEQEVRLAAERILIDHLRPFSPKGEATTDTNPLFWANLDLDLRDAVLQAADYQDCEIGAARFNNATFLETARFDRTTFKGRADFGGARFQKSAYLGNVRFRQHAWFGGTKFDGKVEFRGATFKQVAHFGSATFKDEVHFQGFVATKGANFDKAEFFAKADFESAYFGRRSYFQDAIFLGYTRFVRSNFAKDAIFTGALFAEEANFRQCTWNADVVFQRVSFGGKVDLRRIAVYGQTSFESSQFDKEIRTSGSVLHRSANFKEATFRHQAHFARMTFKAEAKFTRATFARHARFYSSTFGEYVSFGGTKFEGSVAFDGVNFKGTGYFAGSRFRQGCLFTRTEFEDAASFKEASWGSTCGYVSVTFSGQVRFDSARFMTPPNFVDCRAIAASTLESQWPNEWQVHPTTYRLVSKANQDGAE